MKNIIIVIAAVLVLGLGGWYFLAQKSQETSIMKNQETNMMASSDSDDEASNSNNTSTENTLANLIKSGGNKTCTYEFTSQDGATISGAVYISGDKMRSNYEMTQANNEMTGSMIRDGDTMYTWSSTMPEGIKMKFDMDKMMDLAKNIQKNEEETSTNTPTNIDMNMQMDYKCDNWNPDNNMFNPPSDITFRDMSGMMETIQNGMDSEKMCAMCANLQGDSKTKCLAQFNCQ